MKDTNKSVGQHIKEQVSVIGENIQVHSHNCCIHAQPCSAWRDGCARALRRSSVCTCVHRTKYCYASAVTPLMCALLPLGRSAAI